MTFTLIVADWRMHGHRCIKSKAASLWNALPIELKNEMSVNMFKKKLSYHLLSML